MHSLVTKKFVIITLLILKFWYKWLTTVQLIWGIFFNCLHLIVHFSKLLYTPNPYKAFQLIRGFIKHKPLTKSVPGTHILERKHTQIICAPVDMLFDVTLEVEER